MRTDEKTKNLARSDYIIGTLMVGLPFILYLKTLSPTVTWGDPAKLANFAYSLKLGLHAADHPLHTVIGWVWGKLPFGDYAYSQNLLSAVFASLTVGLLYWITWRLTGSRIASGVASLTLAVSHTFWWLAVINESYALFFFLLSAALLSVLAWDESKQDCLVGLSFVALGLAMATHYLTWVFVPIFGVWVLGSEPKPSLWLRRVAWMAGGFLIGSSLLVYIFIELLATGRSWQMLVNTMFGASVSPYWAGLGKIASEIPRYPLYLAYQFPGLAFLLGLVGIWAFRNRQRRAGILLLLLFAADVVFSSGYMRQRQPEIMVPSYMFFAIGTGMGMAHLGPKLRLLEKQGAARLLSTLGLFCLLGGVPVVTYYAMPSILEKTGLRPLDIRSIPYRDNNRYFFLPDKSGYYGADRYGREVLTMLPANAVILVDFTPGAVLQYLQLVEGRRPDVLIIGIEVFPVGRLAHESVNKYFGQRPMYVTDYRTYPQYFAIERLSEGYEFVPKGFVFLLGKKQGSK